MTLEEAIHQYSNIVENKIKSAEQAKKKLDKLLELQKLKEKRLDGEQLTEQEIREAMKLLCWNNYAGCCAPYKECPWNNAVSDALGIDYEQLYKVKKWAVEEFLGIKGKE